MARNAAIEWFRKTAALRTQLQPHQQRVVDKIKQPDQPGLVVAHGLGSGKTLAAIAAQDELGMPASVVLPAALRANYVKEQKKHVVGQRPKTQIASMEQTARVGAPPDNPMLVVDEAHRVRTPGTKTNQALKANSAEKRLLLTGSPFYNHPADIAPLVNIASGATTLPESRADFSDEYVLEKKVRPGLVDRLFRGVKPGVVAQLNPRTRDRLGDVLGKWVDYHPSSREGFPDVKREDVEVPMTGHQLRVYDSILGEAPPWVAAKIRRGLPPSKQEAKELNAFLSGARQVANSTRAFESESATLPAEPKIDRAFEELKKELDANPRAKAAVYSNWLESGISPYRQRLQQAGIPFGEFTGEQDRGERDQLVQDYNEGKIRALLLSSAGGEGLDLKGTRLMQILDPHWNEEKLRQVEGRGARYMSHADLPEDERSMRVQRYVSTRPKKGVLERIGLKKPGYAVDQYLTRLSADKARLNNEFVDLLAQRSQQPAVANAPTSSLSKAADFAEGLPARGVAQPVREVTTPETWRFAVQHHPAARAGDHYDLRLVDASRGIAHSWATKKELPKPGGPAIQVFQQGDHRPSYVDFEGHLRTGYGRTREGSEGVRKVLDEAAEIRSAGPKRVRFSLRREQQVEEFVLSKNARSRGAPAWTLLNVTKTASVASRVPWLSKEQREARRRTDSHFKGGPDRWTDFIRNARRRSFVAAVQSDPRSDEKLQRHVDQMNRLLTGKTVDRVRGSSGTYRIVQLRGGDGLGCTCDDWRYRRSVAPAGDQDCKHLKAWKKDNMTYKIPGGPVAEIPAGPEAKVGGFGPEEAEHQRARNNALHEVAGLGILAAPSMANLGTHLPGRAGTAFKPIAAAIGHGPAEHAIEVAGLGVLARPSVQELREKPGQKMAELLAAPWPAKVGDASGGGRYISTHDRAAWREKQEHAKVASGDGCTIDRDDDGYYCRTHRARSRSYPSVESIPEGEVRRVASTA